MKDIRRIVISLNRRQDRRKAMIQNWNHDSFEWFDAIESQEPKQAEQCCRASHLAVLKLCNENEWTLILEDDAHWITGQENAWPTIYPDEDTAIAYFGCAVHRWNERNTIWPHTLPSWESVHAWYAHAYAVNGKYVKQLIQIIEQSPSNMSIDTIYCMQTQLKCQAYLPSLLIQAPGISDITQTTINREQKIIALDLLFQNSSPICVSLVQNSFNRKTIENEWLRLGITKPVLWTNSFSSLIQSAQKHHISWMIVNTKDTEMTETIDISTAPKDWELLLFQGETDEWLQKTGNASLFAIRISLFNHYSIPETITEEWFETIQKNVYQRKFQFYRPIQPNYKVSIVTPILNGRIWFWNALYCFLKQDYPSELIEWIILDEGISNLKEKIPNDPRIIYKLITEEERKRIYIELKRRLKKKKQKLLPEHANGDFWKHRLPIGLKRNWLASCATGDIIVHWDDDDWYPSTSISQRVNYLIQSKAKIVGCTTIPCFDTVKCISWMNVPPQTDPIYLRTSEATMAYWKTSWESQHFEPQSIGTEGAKLIQGRESYFFEIPYLNVIVSLVHRSNLSSRRCPENQEPNGWHFQTITDTEFTLLTELDNPSCKNLELFQSFVLQNYK